MFRSTALAMAILGAALAVSACSPKPSVSAEQLKAAADLYSPICQAQSHGDPKADPDVAGCGPAFILYREPTSAQRHSGWNEIGMPISFNKRTGVLMVKWSLGGPPEAIYPMPGINMPGKVERIITPGSDDIVRGSVLKLCDSRADVMINEQTKANLTDWCGAFNDFVQHDSFESELPG